ncbi:5-carboxymethyl-2-hydroxymuconate isomerase [Pseudomonas aeruginosa]|uniref:fumarylacetoacetate hydrolase family protein n=1 Tax=Pseudomonas aeruginosa TaxID=287 RepID=UPI000FFEDB47|nr:fumarylacetoacetate hydrolase family protein [Pseudomonas aeruginosa]MBG4604170.1 fumarylacetoacetate hydrolase family protein [Pseudomonas aeruginosa]MBH8257461.1 fumarylacetoacetate hydrolase family protein [Pseudomonas aeruginosa]MCV3907768.1 fumarylacetoacetate hydrolase family protein [Pseudomonas aeruginosa]NPS39676.1 fumarylacetoacetate hydrolase family protein [Pseudomonas aeruginosa]NPS89148.1 fumarylacetoacetate hydrolase family protein [Pseudomonas aeruginosa]
MKLARYSYNGRTALGKVEGEYLIDLSEVLPGDARDVAAIIACPQLLLAAKQLQGHVGNRLPLNQLRLLAPITNPSKFLALGMNYKDHEEEARRAGVPIPTSQVWFSKQTSCINGPYDDVHFPKVCERLDYEAELGVVIGKPGRYIDEEDALDHVAGYFVTNDVSSRDWQAKSPTWTLGKSFDTHGPIGPWITTADEVADPQALNIRLEVNGEVRQNSSTSKMTYPVARQIAYLSQVMTLNAGDILITGTPAGIGLAMTPPTFLKIGDVIRVAIDGLGHIENQVVADPY